MAGLLDALRENVSAALVDAGVAGPLAIVRETPGEPDPDEPWNPGDPVTVEHPCRGWRDQFEQELIDGTLIRTTDWRIVILASSIGITPTTSDKVLVEGQSLNIVSVRRDPAGAIFDVQARA